MQADPQQRPWLASYPQGIPAQIDYDALQTLDRMLSDSVAGYPDHPAFSNFGTQLSFTDVDRMSAAFSAHLDALPGMQPGERVALMLPNLLQYPISMYGVLRAGMTVVNVNPLYTAPELRHQLIDSGATTIVILENFAHILQQVIAETRIKHVIITRAGDLLDFPKSTLINVVLKYIKHAVPKWQIDDAINFKKMLRPGLEPVEIDVKLDDLAFLQYTGGTTGLSKGVMLSHANLSANLQQARLWAGDRLETGREIAITALPLYHIFSLTANCLFFTMVGGLNVLITNPRDFKGFVKEMKQWRFSFISGVNTLYAALLDTPGFTEINFSQLKTTLGAGMAVTRDVAKRWKRMTGCTLLEVYGLSETSPAVCINPPDLIDYNGLVGLPIPSTDVKVVDQDGQQLPQGEEGELCIKGPQVTSGYWQAEELNTALFTSDGYMRSGDYACMTAEGFIRILDRKKDMINVSGFKVYPNEIEDIVSDHPQVREAAAIGVEDNKSGERVKLFVVAGSSQLNQDALFEWCRQNMTSYKLPIEIEFREELPKSAIGKILRRALRDS